MGEGATGQAVMPQMLTAAQEHKYLTAWEVEELEALRRDLGGTWELRVTAADLEFTAWRAGGTGERLATRDPRQLRGLIAACEQGRAVP
jgi:hypothetical protein